MPFLNLSVTQPPTKEKMKANATVMLVMSESQRVASSECVVWLWKSSLFVFFLKIPSTWILFSPEIHIPLNEGHSPRDDSGVVAEEEAAHGGEGDGKVEQDGILAHPGAWPEGEANI